MTDSDDERVRRIAQHVVGVIMPNVPNWIERDDLEQEAALGIVRAMRRYDSSRADDWGTFAYVYARAHVIDLLRREGPTDRGKERPRLVPLDGFERASGDPDLGARVRFREALSVLTYDQQRAAVGRAAGMLAFEMGLRTDVVSHRLTAAKKRLGAWYGY